MPDTNYASRALARRLAVAHITQQTPVIQPAIGGVVKNASGSTVVDSTGVVSSGLISLLGQAANTNNLYTTTNTTATPIPSVSITITLNRQLTVRADVQCGATSSGAGGTQTTAQLYVDGVVFGGAALSAASFVFQKQTTAVSLQSGWQIVTLAPGTHTFDVRTACDAGQTYAHFYAELDLYQIGS